MSLDGFEVSSFDSAREVSHDVNTFLNLRFIKKQKPAGFSFFFRIYYMLANLKLRRFH